jgi:predicted PurR-regulated permease PerM
MPERIRKISEQQPEPEATGRERDPKKGIHEHVIVEGEHLAVEHNGEAVVLPLELGSSNAQRFVAFAVLLALCYFGKLVLATLMFAVLLTFALEPIVELLERIRLPRSVGALIALLLLGGLLYGISYFSYVRATNFVQELPKYTEKIKETVLKFRQQTQQLEKTGQTIAPAGEKGAMPVRQVSTGLSGLTSAAGTLTETALAISFIPFLAYFMLTWRDHARAGAVRLFKPEDRTNAYVVIGRIAKMLRGFIVGNLVIGVMMGVMSVLAFWWIGVPYFYFIGFISGILSLIPYLGVIAALLPPLAASLGQLGLSHLAEIIIAVLAIHLFAFNVLYPKFLGPRMQLNPLIVTIALLIWGFLWGAVGLILAVPITAAVKIICDHVDSLRPLGELMGEGRGSS